MSQPVPEACKVQQLPNAAKIFANFSLPYIRIISLLCIIRVRDMFLFVFHSGIHRSVVNQSQKLQGWKLIGLFLFRLPVVRWTLFLHPPRNSDWLQERNVGNNRHILLG